MLRTYLENIQKEYTDERIHLDEELEKIETRIREDEKMTEVLEKETAETFQDFSPRDYQSKNRSHLDELSSNLSAHKGKRAELLSKQKEIDEHLSQLDSAFRELDLLEEGKVPENESVEESSTEIPLNSIGDSSEKNLSAKDETSVQENVSSEVDSSESAESSSEDKKESFSENSSSSNVASISISREILQDLLHQCRQISSYLPVDTMRAKMEMEELEQSLRKISTF